jgi:hypothetical protein
MEEIIYVQKNQLSVSMNNIRHNSKYQGRTEQGIMSQSLNGMQNATFNKESSSAAAIQQQQQQQDLGFNNLVTVSSTMTRSAEIMEVQQEQIIDQQSMINHCMKGLMEFMRQSAMSRKLIKKIPNPFPKKELMACRSGLSLSVSTSTSTSSLLLSSSSASSSAMSKIYASTNNKQAVVVKAKRYSNQQKKYKIKTQLSAVKRINPFSTRTTRRTTTATATTHIPSEITIIATTRCPDNNNDDDDESSLSDMSEALHTQVQVQVQAQAKSHHYNTTTHNKYDNMYDNNDDACYSISRPFFDDGISFTSSIEYGDMASLSLSSNDSNTSNFIDSMDEFRLIRLIDSDDTRRVWL